METSSCLEIEENQMLSSSVARISECFKLANRNPGTPLWHFKNLARVYSLSEVSLMRTNSGDTDGISKIKIGLIAAQ